MTKLYQLLILIGFGLSAFWRSSKIASWAISLVGLNILWWASSSKTALLTFAVIVGIGIAGLIANHYNEKHGPALEKDDPLIRRDRK